MRCTPRWGEFSLASSQLSSTQLSVTAHFVETKFSTTDFSSRARRRAYNGAIRRVSQSFPANEKLPVAPYWVVAEC
jgi:hypothetical protein